MHSSLCIQGQAYSDPGATAYDAVDGAITAVTVKGLSAINTLVVSVRLALRLYHTLNTDILNQLALGAI